MRKAPIAFCMLLSPLTPAIAQLSINFATPGVSIGINVPVYPTLQRVPGYPVYYAPGLDSNYFFYDGMYWVYGADNWYASSWYNGPWAMVDRFDVPVYLLRVPVRYYRHAPSYFHGWRADAPPRWGDHWGSSWEQQRTGWNQWNRSSSPAPAPLPTYQRRYSGNLYPQQTQQAVLQARNYRYQPADAVSQQHYQHLRTQAQSAPAQQQAPQQAPQQHAAPRQQAPQQQAPQQYAAPRQQAPQQQAPQQHGAPRREPGQAPAEKAPEQAPATREQRAPPQAQGQGQGQAHGQDKGKGHEKDDKEKGSDKGHGG